MCAKEKILGGIFVFGVEEVVWYHIALGMGVDSMTKVIHTDASSKNGYSAWCYLAEGEKPVAGIVHTMNTAAVETLAALKAIEKYGHEGKILIISDCLITTLIIQQKEGWNYTTSQKPTLYQKIRNQLRLALRKYTVDSVWVPSKSRNPQHVIVDQMSRDVVNEHLKGLI